MRSKHERPYLSMKEIRHREGMRATWKAAMEAWTTGPGILVLLTFTSLLLVDFGGMHEAVPALTALTPGTLIEAVAAESAYAGEAPRKEEAFSDTAKVPVYVPSLSVNQSREGRK